MYGSWSVSTWVMRTERYVLKQFIVVNFVKVVIDKGCRWISDIRTNSFTGKYRMVVRGGDAKRGDDWIQSGVGESDEVVVVVCCNRMCIC